MVFIIFISDPGRNVYILHDSSLTPDQISDSFLYLSTFFLHV